MTIAEHVWRELHRKGLDEGRLDVAMTMLARALYPVQVVKVTGLSIVEVNAITPAAPPGLRPRPLQAILPHSYASSIAESVDLPVRAFRAQVRP